MVDLTISVAKIRFSLIPGEDLMVVNNIYSKRKSTFSYFCNNIQGNGLWKIL